jgi:hypothetical protein
VKTSSSPSPSHYANLSPAWKRLVDVLGDLQFGRVERLVCAGGEPQFDRPYPPPTIVRTIRLPADHGICRAASSQLPVEAANTGLASALRPAAGWRNTAPGVPPRPPVSLRVCGERCERCQGHPR